MYKSVAIMALIASANASFFDKLMAFNFGACPSPPKAVGNFEPEKYSGTWYEIFRDKNIWYESDTKQCVTTNYQYQSNRKLYVKNSGMNTDTKKYSDTNLPSWVSSVTSSLLGLTDTQSQATFDKDGNGHVKFWWYLESNYQILDTDYEKYSVAYGCDNWPASWLPIVHTREAWLLSR